MGKSLHGLQYLSQVLKDRTAEKYYMALVAGEVDEPMTIEGFLTKDEAVNKVQINQGLCMMNHREQVTAIRREPQWF